MYIIINVFHFIITFLKIQSDMSETKAVSVSISLFSLIATSFCIYQDHKENKMGHHSEIVQGPREKEYKKYCLKRLRMLLPS